MKSSTEGAGLRELVPCHGDALELWIVLFIRDAPDSSPCLQTDDTDVGAFLVWLCLTILYAVADYGIVAIDLDIFGTPESAKSI